MQGDNSLPPVAMDTVCIQRFCFIQCYYLPTCIIHWLSTAAITNHYKHYWLITRVCYSSIWTVACCSKHFLKSVVSKLHAFLESLGKLVIVGLRPPFLLIRNWGIFPGSRNYRHSLDCISHNTVSSLHMNKFYSKSMFLSPICL